MKVAGRCQAPKRTKKHHENSNSSQQLLIHTITLCEKDANLSCNLKACTCMAYVYATFMLFLLYYIEAQVNCINAFIFIFY